MGVNDKVEMADTSGKDTDSNGKKDGPLTQVLVEETGLTPSMKKLNVGVKTEEGGEGASPKPKRERKKSKSKGEEKSGDGKERVNLPRRKVLRRAANHQLKQLLPRNFRR